MNVDLDELKAYLRIDNNDEDGLLEQMALFAEQTCMDISRIYDPGVLFTDPVVKIAVFYAVAYLNEHREDADINELNLTLRAMLFGIREGPFV